MKKNSISTVSRILVFLCGIALIAVLFVPMWRIELDAPQYPEGLRLLIYANKIAGDVDIVNGLNHYIGMNTLHTEDFLEFTILPGIILFFIAMFLLSAFIGKRKWLYWLLTLFILFGVVAMVDFWRWEYNYGHNLDPNAAIVVPGMAYQPPLIGFKQLLNFGAYSIPDTGGWIFIGVGVLLLITVIIEWRKAKITSGKIPVVPAAAVLVSMLTLAGCTASPDPIALGKDQCNACKMTISDDRFGAELVTKKHKIYKFDDPHCLIEFKKSGAVKEADIDNIYFVNFSSPHQFIKTQHVLLLKSDNLRSPMNGNIAAFDSGDSLARALENFKGYTVTWNEIAR